MSRLQSHHHVVNFSTWCFSIYQTARRIWLRILSIALVKELKVLLTVLNECIIIIWFPLTVFFWFPLFLHFFHFSDWTYAQTKGRLKTWGGGGVVQTTGSCSVLHWQREFQKILNNRLLWEIWLVKYEIMIYLLHHILIDKYIVSWNCSNRLPQIRWLETTEISSFTILENKSPRPVPLD